MRRVFKTEQDDIEMDEFIRGISDLSTADMSKLKNKIVVAQQVPSISGNPLQASVLRPDELQIILSEQPIQCEDQ